jgi:hypothetical protein
MFSLVYASPLFLLYALGKVGWRFQGSGVLLHYTFASHLDWEKVDGFFISKVSLESTPITHVRW